ncbi:unnamed protein product [Durusdinium trenchii]|uniref:Reverse transcriptase domain-containing protein n=1 Tax=Durusdinium trenchii TaxID=1381693 RepID=A0ABP0HZ03_9DINO
MGHTSACGLFPLPRPDALPKLKGYGRRSQHRAARRVRIRDDLREAIASLNWMHVGDFDAPPSAAHPLQREVLCRLEALVERADDLGDHGHLPSLEAAYGELLRGRDGYAEPSTPASLAPYNLELVSLPTDLCDAPRAEELLEEADRRYLQGQERMLREIPKEDSEVIKPYWDPALRHNPGRYRKFIQRLNGIKYLDFTLSPSQHAGVFFVWKSDGKRIRMIVDARPANAEFEEPPGISLPTAETFAKIEMETHMHDGDDPELGIYAGLSDVRDCFHRIKQPRWLSKYFCFLPIEAKHVGLTGTVLEGHTLSSNDLVFPMPGSLCMGFSWSLFFAQRINEVVMRRVSSLSSSTLIHDRGGPAVFGDHLPDELKHFVYVDNLGVMSTDRQAVSGALDDLVGKFTQEKLLLHPGEIQHECIKALGVQLDGQNLFSSLSPDRYHRVRQGLRCLLRRGRCSGRVLEILIGHCTYCGLMNRALLSVFHNVYKFIHSHHDHPATLWNSVRAELRAFCGLMPLIASDWCRPWNELVPVSDASEEGFGVCAAVWTSSQAAAVGRVSERDRFKRAGSHSARETALTSAGFVKDEVSGKWAEGILDDEEYLKLSGWDLRTDFPEVPAHKLREGSWQTVRQGRWKKHEHIVHLEARALVKSFEYLVEDTHSKDCRQLFLVDSMSAALAFDRCRSRNFKMLRQIRKFCSYGLARNISFSVRTSSLQRTDPTVSLLKKPSFLPPSLESLVKGMDKLPQPRKQMEPDLESAASSSSSEPARDVRTKALAKRSRGRLQKYVQEAMEAKSMGLSLLEKKAIGDRSAKYYQEEYKQLLIFAKTRKLMMTLPRELDATLVEYFNDLFMRGHPAHRGDKIIATVMHHQSEYSKLGSSRLPRAWRCLKGWRRLAPGTSRKAYPLGVWCAIALELKRLGHLQMAVFTLVGLSSYSRPSELLRCRAFSLVKPSPGITEFWSLLLNPEERMDRSKVGEFDDSIALDSPWMRPWAATLLKPLASQGADLPLWNFNYSHYFKVFSQVTETLGLDMTPYQMRHSGPSIDRSRNLRSLLEVQKRGRWRSHKSVARYEKSARLAATFQMLPPPLQHHCLLAERQLGDVMLGRAPALRPPTKAKG